MWSMFGTDVEERQNRGMTSGATDAAINVDALLLAELDYVRRRPFGHPKLAERLEATPTLTRLAAQLYGRAESLSSRDEQQRALLSTAARHMIGTNGLALLALLGLTRETSGQRLKHRQDIAGPAIYPVPYASSTLGKQRYVVPFLQQAVLAIRQVAGPATAAEPREATPLRDVVLPLIERDDIDGLTYSLHTPFDPATRAHVVVGLPGSGRFTTADQALARVTRQNRHVVRLGDPAAYHRDLLDVLDTYGIDGRAWSLAACEREFQGLVERDVENLGGVILRGARTLDDVRHLLPRRRATHVLVTAGQAGARPEPGIDVHHATALESPEAIGLLRTGHPDAPTELLEALAALLYGHAGLLSAAARARLTVATLIRRLRRAPLAAIRDLALSAHIGIDADAQQHLAALQGDPDALLALDLGLWVTGFGHWDQYHCLGYAFGLDASPARISSAQTRLARARIPGNGDHGLVRDLLAGQRAHRMTPMLQWLATLDIPDHPLPGLQFHDQPAAGEPLHADRGGPITLLRFPFGLGHTLGVTFHDDDGVPHAQLWRHTREPSSAYVLYEDGHERGDHRTLDPARDSQWPGLTERLLSRLEDHGYLDVTGIANERNIAFFEGPTHHDHSGLLDASEVIQLDDFGAATDLADWNGELHTEPPPRDETVDEEAAELFA